MIDHVIAGEYLNVVNNKGATPWINTNALPMTGVVAYDHDTQRLKVNDGNSWMSLGGGNATVNLSPVAISILKWAENKMQEEKELLALCNQHPTIKSIVDQMNMDIANYQNKIAMIKILIKEEEKVGTS